MGSHAALPQGFVYTSHDVSDDLLDTAYGMLREFFEKSPEVKQAAAVPGANGQTGYTGLLVETAASSDKPDWKEMLNWSTPVPAGHPLKRTFPTAYPDQVLPEQIVPGITDVLYRFHDTVADLQRRFLRVIAEGIGCHETFFDDMVAGRAHADAGDPLPGDGRTRSRRREGTAPGRATCGRPRTATSTLITALPRATAPGLQVKVGDEWADAVAPDDGVIVNTGIMLERLTNGRHSGRLAPRRRLASGFDSGERYSVVQFCHPRVRGPCCGTRAVVLHARHPAAVLAR